jgi:UDP-N-acetylglucosamine 2-epimerase
MKLAIVVGTRPEIIRLSATIKLARKVFDTVLIHTGQNYDHELNEVFFKDLELKEPDFYLDCLKDNLGTTVGDIIKKSYELLVEIKPDALLVLGDTNSCLCGYSAKRLKIPLFHLEAGNRCFDPNVPEEINRKVIDHLADVNVCYTEHARRNLIQEGLKPQYTFVSGSPMSEVLKSIEHKIQQSTILNDLKLESKEYFLISCHREENVNISNNFEYIVESIKKLEETYDKTIIISLHPRTKKMLIEKNINFGPKVIQCKPFGIIDYCNLQKNALCVISDSGTLTEESSMLNFPGVLLRTSTERPEGVDAGNMILGGLKWDILSESLKLILNKTEFSPIVAYNDLNFSEKVCNIVCGYREIVNKFIWMK